jgi:hypothetical protein
MSIFVINPSPQAINRARPLIALEIGMDSIATAIGGWLGGMGEESGGLGIECLPEADSAVSGKAEVAL